MMKTAVCLFFFLILLAVTLSANLVTNQPYEQIQPDGTTLKLFVSGDEYYHRVHDANNYTVLMNPQTGYSVYAIPDGNSIKASEYLVGKINPGAVGIQPNLMKKESEAEKFHRTQQAETLRETRTSPTGSYNNLVLFVRFQDQTEFPTTTRYSAYNNLFNSRTQQSLKDYYAEVSSNQLMIDSYLYPAATGNGYVASLMVPYNRGWYSPFDLLNNPLGYPNETIRNEREYALAVLLISSLDVLVPDNIDVDSDNDLLVDQITFLFRGPADTWGDILWPSNQPWQTVLGSINGAFVYKYVKIFEGGLDTSVICHETGHNIGFPDLYHYNHDGKIPVGSWDLMATDNTQHELTYLKWKYGHWFETIPTITPTSVSVQYTLTAIDQNPYSCYKIQSNHAEEYYMLEYRRGAGRYEIGVPATGLIVYRVLSSYFNSEIDGNSDGPPDEVYVYRPGGDITNEGDINTANFSSTVGRLEFNNDTDPQPWLYAFPGMQMDGNLVLTDIGVSGGNTITFRVRNSILPEYIWDGSTSNEWAIASNWSRNEVPTTTSNVLIPYGVPNYPRSASTRAINDLHVEPGATITLGAGTLQVRGNFENQGNLAMNHTDAALVVEGDMFFRSGSVTSITNAGALMVFHGNLNFDAGSNVDMVQGTVQFNDTGNSYIAVNAPTQIGELIAQVTAPSYLYVISDNGSKLTINGPLYIWANCHMSITSEMTVAVTGDFDNLSGYFTCTAGTVIMEGNTSTSIDNSVVSTNYFHDLKIAKSGGATVTLTTAVEVMGRLRIEPGASLLNAGKSMIIHEDLLSYGFLNLTGTDDIYVYNDILWGIGATASVASNNITIQVAGDMTFLPGSNIDLDYGIFYFYANGISTIGVYENATISVIGCFKSDPYYLAIDGDASRALNIGMGIQVDAGYILKVIGPANIHMTGFLTINGLLQCNDGAFIFDGNTDSNLTCSSTAGNYFHDLTIIKQTNHKLNLLADLMIKGNLLITEGILQTNNYTIESKGNWTNNIGEPGFLFGSSQVIFSGTGNQYCYGEHFNTMVLNKTGGELIFPSGSFSRCMNYDWTAGSLRVDGGDFVADDLVDPGIYGTFTLNSGNIELFQDAASLIDLNASLTIHGGNFRIYGGSAASRWANGVNAGITMDGGVLDFIDNGILNRTSSYTMTLNLTGGKIRTDKNLSITRSSTVIPTGTFELYGSTDAIVTFGSGTGISIPNLIIDKGAKMGADIDSEHEPMNFSRNSSDDIQRTSVASANSNLIINGYLSVVSGTFSVNGKTIQVGSSVSVNGTLQMTSVGGAYGSITCGGDFIWNSGSVSNITGGTIQYGESWKFNSGSNVVLTSCPVTFAGTSNAFITSSSTTANFGNLILNGSRVSGEPVFNYMSIESTQPLVILGTLVINNDNYLYLGGKTLSTNDNITLTGDALLALDANSVLKLASAKTLTVNTGATLQVLGCYGHPATITHQTGYYVVNIESGANISARYGVFEYMGTSGINVKSGAIVNTTNTFNYCTFQNGAASGALLTMNSTQTLTSYGTIFPTNTWSGNYNVSKSTVGTITFINATGGFSGESYDGDPMFRVFWTSDTYELTHLWDGADHSNLYVCDPVVFNIAIYNPSVSNILTPFRVDIYHNRASAPAVGEEGDQYVVVDSLNASSSIELFFPATSSTTAGTWQTWFQIDTYNEIAESNETNNIFSSVTTTWNAMPEVTTPTIFYDTQLNLLQLNWTYPISAHNYVIYRSDSPNGPFTQVGTTINPSYSETLTNNKYFYRITAVKIWQ